MRYLKRFNESFEIKHEYGEYLVKELEEALKQYGEYQYEDKGANEVMNCQSYVDDLESKSPEEIVDIFSYVLDNHDNSDNLIDCLISMMDDRDDFDEIIYDIRGRYPDKSFY